MRIQEHGAFLFVSNFESASSDRRKRTHQDTMDIFVDNLPLDLTDEILFDLFGIYGEVTSATVMRSCRSGDAIGMAMVSMRESKQAQVAVEKLNDTVMDGEPIVVSRFATPLA